MKEAMFYQKRSNGDIDCLLCPHNCHISEGNLGFCKVRKNQNGKLYTLNYGKITGAAYDPIEKKPLYEFYPGEIIFSIGSYGCNFRCDFCQNYQLVYDHERYSDADIDRLWELAGANGSIGIAYTYNEPTIWYEYMYDISCGIRDRKLKNIMVTNGYINQEPLKKLLPLLDAMNIDLKAYSDAFYKKICSGTLEPVLKTIETAANCTHIEVTTLLIDGENDRDIEAIAKFLGDINSDIPLHISRYFPRFKRNTPVTDVNSLYRAEEIARKHLNKVYLGNI
ncbi:MAG: AmmeMemoRadiSam system radical SAM enzyme [Tissierellia bacterium]|nr:AmmeMemoRadiSam system radical SAM enzyme [Tissierellia bacterium]